MCILFVDDEFIIAMMAEDALRGAGHEVMVAEHAPAAVRLITDYPDHFTCLVTDIHMPGDLTGLDLVEHARQTYPLLPVLVATGRPDVVAPVWRERHKAELLIKPYTPELLVGIVEGLLRDA